jgi:hypothetical protein
VLRFTPNSFSKQSLTTMMRILLVAACAGIAAHATAQDTDGTLPAIGQAASILNEVFGPCLHSPASGVLRRLDDFYLFCATNNKSR